MRFRATRFLSERTGRARATELRLAVGADAERRASLHLDGAVVGPGSESIVGRELCECRVHNAQLPQFPRLQVWVYATEATKEEVASEGPPVVEGLPKFDDTMDKISMENKSRATLAFACGHSSLVNAIWDSCIARTSQGTRFDFHKQSFDW